MYRHIDNKCYTSTLNYLSKMSNVSSVYLILLPSNTFNFRYDETQLKCSTLASQMYTLEGINFEKYSSNHMNKSNHIKHAQTF